MMKLIGVFGGALAAGAVAAWVFWGALLPWAISIAPANVWWWKPVCMVVIGYFGGITVPFIVTVLAFGVLTQVLLK